MPPIRLALLAAAMLASTTLAAQEPDWRNAQSVRVEISNFKFLPATIPLVHGHAYVLHLVNLSGSGHNLTAPAFFGTAVMPAADRAHLVKGGFELDGHGVIDIHFVAPRPGSYAMRCTHFLHASFGMTGKLVVS